MTTNWNALTVSFLLAVAAVAQAQTRPATHPSGPPGGGLRNGMGMRVAGTRPPDEPVVPGQPLEHRDSFGSTVGQTPAFSGQTRAPAVVTKTAYEEKIVAHGLKSLWALAFLPDGRILVTEKPGSMRIITQDGKVGDPLSNVPEVVFGGDAGLLDLVLDPDFSKSREIYFTYVEPRGGRNNGLSVAKARLGPDDKSLENGTAINKV